MATLMNNQAADAERSYPSSTGKQRKSKRWIAPGLSDEYDIVSMGHYVNSSFFLRNVGWRRHAFPLDWSAATFKVWQKMLSDNFATLLIKPEDCDSKVHPYNSAEDIVELFIWEGRWAGQDVHKRVDRLKASLDKRRVFGVAFYFEGLQNGAKTVRAPLDEIVEDARILLNQEAGFAQIVLVWFEKTGTPKGSSRWFLKSDRLSLLRYVPLQDLNYYDRLLPEDEDRIASQLRIRFPHVFAHSEDNASYARQHAKESTQEGKLRLDENNIDAELYKTRLSSDQEQTKRKASNFSTMLAKQQIDELQLMQEVFVETPAPAADAAGATDAACAAEATDAVDAADASDAAVAADAADRADADCAADATDAADAANVVDASIPDVAACTADATDAADTADVADAAVPADADGAADVADTVDTAQKPSDFEGGGSLVDARILDTRPRYCIAGTWSGWTVEELAWDEQLSCCHTQVRLGASGRESFQILLNGDWNKTLYPDIRDACPDVKHKICGPGRDRHGKKWTIGLSYQDVTSCEYKLSVFLSTAYEVQLVTWEPLEKKLEKQEVGEPSEENEVQKELQKDDTYSEHEDEPLPEPLVASSDLQKTDDKLQQEESTKEQKSIAEQGGVAAQERPRYCIAGTWSDWAVEELTWDEQHMSYHTKISLGQRGTESFQILLDRDWSRTVYPDTCDACPSVKYKICGPDDNGHGKNWTISTDEKGVNDICQYRICILMSQSHEVEMVTWHLVVMSEHEKEKVRKAVQDLRDAKIKSRRNAKLKALEEQQAKRREKQMVEKTLEEQQAKIKERQQAEQAKRATSRRNIQANSAALRQQPQHVMAGTTKLLMRDIWEDVEWTSIGHIYYAVALTGMRNSLFCATSYDEFYVRDTRPVDLPWSMIGHAQSVVSMDCFENRLLAVLSDASVWLRPFQLRDVPWEPEGFAPPETVALTVLEKHLYAVSKRQLWMKKPGERQWAQAGSVDFDVVEMVAADEKLVCATRQNLLMAKGQKDEVWQQIGTLPVPVHAMAYLNGKVYIAVR